MYIDYSKLWKLLIDKDMTKTELLDLTGISSRVIAKLSKNQTVTTDTIAKICTALECNVSDIMEVVSEEKLTLYQHYQRLGKVIAENDMCKTITFTANGKKYRIYASKKAATKSTHIHCKENKTIYWEQLYVFNGLSSVASEECVFIRPEINKDEQAIVLIKGKPGIITGLDENGFVSAHGLARKESDIYVMSETAFKIFEIKK